MNAKIKSIDPQARIQELEREVAIAAPRTAGDVRRQAERVSEARRDDLRRQFRDLVDSDEIADAGKMLLAAVGDSDRLLMLQGLSSPEDALLLYFLAKSTAKVRAAALQALPAASRPGLEIDLISDERLPQFVRVTSRRSGLTDEISAADRHAADLGRQLASADPEDTGLLLRLKRQIGAAGMRLDELRAEAKREVDTCTDQPIAISDDLAEVLTDAEGIRVEVRGGAKHGHYYFGWHSYARDHDYSPEVWAALQAADPELRAFVAAGKVVAAALSPKEVRTRLKIERQNEFMRLR